jgi:hypothetical protein
MRPSRRRASRNNPYKEHISLRTIWLRPSEIAVIFDPYTDLFLAIAFKARLCEAWHCGRNRQMRLRHLLPATAQKKAARVGVTQAASAFWPIGPCAS